MSVRNSQANRRRWKNPAYREVVGQRISAALRDRYGTKISVGTTPTRAFPQLVTDLLDTLTDHCLEVISCERIRVDGDTCYGIALIDGTDLALRQRYSLFVRECGLNLYRIYREPLPDGGGISVVLSVGLPTGAH